MRGTFDRLALKAILTMPTFQQYAAVLAARYIGPHDDPRCYSPIGLATVDLATDSLKHSPPTLGRTAPATPHAGDSQRYNAIRRALQLSLARANAQSEFRGIIGMGETLTGDQLAHQADILSSQERADNLSFTNTL